MELSLAIPTSDFDCRFGFSVSGFPDGLCTGAGIAFGEAVAGLRRLRVTRLGLAVYGSGALLGDVSIFGSGDLSRPGVS